MTGRGLLNSRQARSLRALAAIAAVLLALFPGEAFAQSQQSQDIGAVITEPGRLEKLQNLQFGKIVPGGAGGTMTIAPDGAVTTTGSVVALGDAYPAGFVMERRRFVDYPDYIAPTVSDSIVLTRVGDPSSTMTVTGFTTDFNRTIRLGPFTLPAYFFDTEYYFHVGGTLNVGANQKPGTYRGEFEVVLDYN